MLYLFVSWGEIYVCDLVVDSIGKLQDKWFTLCCIDSVGFQQPLFSDNSTDNNSVNIFLNKIYFDKEKRVFNNLIKIL